MVSSEGPELIELAAADFVREFRSQLLVMSDRAFVWVRFIFTSSDRTRAGRRCLGLNGRYQVAVCQALVVSAAQERTRSSWPRAGKLPSSATSAMLVA